MYLSLILNYTHKSLDVQWNPNAPSLYAIFAYIKEPKKFYAEFRRTPTYHGRYRDDGLIIFHGDENEIHDPVFIANVHY